MGRAPVSSSFSIHSCMAPYLQLLAVLPEFQGRNLGLRLLQWMEFEARGAEARQLWLCVSTFNTRAQAFYQRFGFEAVAVLDKLASDASDELLMRKRLSYGAFLCFYSCISRTMRPRTFPSMMRWARPSTFFQLRCASCRRACSDRGLWRAATMPRGVSLSGP